MKSLTAYLLCAILLCQIVSIFSQFTFDEFGRPVSGQRQQRQQDNNANAQPANFNSCNTACRAGVLKEFNPVCGSNQITYDNRRLLNCAQRCGLQITEISQSTCTPSAGGK